MTYPFCSAFFTSVCRSSCLPYCFCLSILVRMSYSVCRTLFFLTVLCDTSTCTMGPPCLSAMEVDYPFHTAMLWPATSLAVPASKNFLPNCCSFSIFCRLLKKLLYMLSFSLSLVGWKEKLMV